VFFLCMCVVHGPAPGSISTSRSGFMSGSGAKKLCGLPLDMIMIGWAMTTEKARTIDHDNLRRH
jgi:hypothetical protein